MTKVFYFLFPAIKFLTIHIILQLCVYFILPLSAKASSINKLLSPNNVKKQQAHTATISFGWHVLGPIPFINGYSGIKFNAILDAEIPLVHSLNPEGNNFLVYDNHKYQWQAIPLPFDSLESPRRLPGIAMPDYSILYASTLVQTDEPLKDIHIAYGSDDYFTIWLDGREIGCYNGKTRSFDWAQSRTEPFNLSPGIHRITIKLVNVTGNSGFGLSFKDKNNKTIPVEIPYDLIPDSPQTNCLPNSSFEVGLTDWAIKTNITGTKIQSKKTQNAPHGQYVLHITLPESQDNSSWIRICSPWKNLNPHSNIYELSLWARSTTPEAIVELALCNATDHELLRNFKVNIWAKKEQFKISSTWQRYAIYFRLAPTYRDAYRAIIKISGNTSNVELDAVSLCLKKDAGDYQPAEALMLGMGTQQRTNLFIEGETVRPFAALYCPDPKKQPSTIIIKIINSEGEPVHIKHADIEWTNEGHARLETSLHELPIGLYQVDIRSKDKNGETLVQRSFNFAVLHDQYNTPSDPNSPFGLHGGANIPEEDARSLKLAGAKAWRLVHFPSWNAVEKVKGQPKWRRDVRLDLAKDNGLVILGNPSYCPIWARRKPSKKFNYRHTRIPPHDMSLFGKFCGDAVFNFGKQIKLWEIWNEPNAGSYWDGTPEEYVELLKYSFQKIKEADPQAQVLGGSISSLDENNMKWLERAAKAGLFCYQDGLAIHGYRNCVPETWVNDLDRLKEMMLDHGATVPIYITEFGYQGVDRIDDRIPYFPRLKKSNLTEREQAAYLVRSYVVAMASGVHQLYWYKWSESRSDNVGPDAHGLLRVYPIRQPKPALIAYNIMATYLDKAKNGRRIDVGDDDIFVYQFNQPESPVWVVWTIVNNQKSVTLEIPEYARVDIVKLLGLIKSREIQDNRIHLILSEDPIFVKPRNRIR